MQFADNNNKTDVFEKLDYYRKNLEVARRVAVSGYLHAMKYHRAANLIDYVFRVHNDLSVVCMLSIHMSICSSFHLSFDLDLLCPA